MPSPVELALLSLLPTTSNVPADLLDLSNSLLAQSRTRAPQLKPEEEISRTYACCHVACERLGKKLALEIGKPMPPVQAKVYEKLKTYLGSVLRTRSATVTPKKRGREEYEGPGDEGKSGGDGGRRVAGRHGSRVVRGVERSVSVRSKNVTVGDCEEEGVLPKSASVTTADSERNTPETSEESGTRAFEHNATDSAADSAAEREKLPWVDPPIFMGPISRLLSENFKTVSVHPFVLEGTVHTLTHLKRLQDAGNAGTQHLLHCVRCRRRTRGPRGPHSMPLDDDRIPALVIAVYLLVAGRRYGFSLEDDDLTRRRDKAVEVVYEFCVHKMRRPKHLIDEHEMKEDVKHFTKRFMDYWLSSAWYLDVPIKHEESSSQDVMDAETEEAEAEELTPARKTEKTPLHRKEKHARRNDSEEDMGPAGLQHGLGTMFQSAVDWLSQDRRGEYANWKQNVLEEIATIDMEGTRV